MTVEGLMPVRGPSYSSEAGIRAFRSGSGGRRKALLIGTSLLVYAAFPSAALAQEECGPPPAGGGTVYVSLDRIATSGSFSDGIVADSSDGTTVFVNNITTTGNNSEGIHATLTGPSFISEGSPVLQINSGTISTSGKYSDGISASNPLGSVSINSGAIHTTGYESNGITVTGGNFISIYSGAITTTENNSLGIDVSIATGDISIVAGTTATQGTASTA